MAILYCRKWEFVPINGQLAHCLAQDHHRGCPRLIALPTEHPKPSNNPRHFSKKDRHAIKRQLSERR